MKARVVPEGMDYNAALTSAKELTDAHISPLLAGMCLTPGYTLGESDQYLSSILTTEDVDKLEPGSSIAVFCPTGAGKSWVVENIALAISRNKLVIILTNRRACKEQLIYELLKKTGHPSIPHDLLDNVHISERLMITTYQEFVRICNRYNGKDVVLFLDECHCLAEDATFSTYPQQMKSYLHRNLDKTTRIYITATPEAVLPIIWDLEATVPSKLRPLNTDNLDSFLRSTPTKDSTRLQMVYLMKADWSYLTFRTFDPNNTEALAAYVKTATEGGKKALIYINDIDKGKKMQELLDDSQHIYSDEDKRMEICEIVENSFFGSTALITTKVAENGLSLHDPDLTVIVAATYDLTVLRQILGRARVNRKKPHEVTLLIPDFNATQLGSIAGQLYMQRQAFDSAAGDPDFSMQYMPRPCPYIYYDAIAKEPVLNQTGRDELQRQCEFIRQLRAEEAEQPHAFVRSVLTCYGKSTDNIEELSIQYDTIKACRDRICQAWEKYKASAHDAECLAVLKDELKNVCNETGAYSKELTSNIQIQTVNEILKFAGIEEKILSKIEVYNYQ